MRAELRAAAAATHAGGARRGRTEQSSTRGCTEREQLSRFLSALRVSVLVAGGEVGEAERAWRISRLPEDAAGCTGLDAQSWREAEMLTCARIRLLTAHGAFDEARGFARALFAVAEKRQLVRTTMRGLALAMTLERRAGDDDRARAHLVTYLRLFRENGYARPLARERADALPLLDDVAGARPVDGTVARTAARLSEAMRESSDAASDPAHQPLTEREFDVLVRLERHRDQEIAEALNLSYDGLRYRVNRIFTKLGARSRLDAVHRARARGILPPSEDASAAER